MTKTLLTAFTRTASDVAPRIKLSGSETTRPSLWRASAPAGLVLLGLALSGAAAAQPANDTVAWTLSAPSADNVKAGSRVALSLRGAVKEGWHVYGLKQLPTGPTPLRISVDKADIAVADGVPSGAAPKKVHDPSFDLETQYYEKPFALTVPVRLGAKLPAGRQLIPVSVRYQTCDGSICHPPKTVQLSAAVNVVAGK